VIPLSFAQARLWFLHRLEGPSATYNQPLAMRLRGALDAMALGTALGDVVARHESLRTVFGEEDGRPFQRILDPARSVPLLSVVECEAGGLENAVREASQHTFDLSWEPPVRASLLKVGPGDHALILVLHHIAGDGWSIGLLLRDLATAYEARLGGRAPEWAPLPVQYADYTLWQRQLMGSEQDAGSPLARGLEYWRGALEGLPDQLELPFDRVRPPVSSYEGGVVELRLDPGLHAELAALAQACRATLFMVVQAALAALLSRVGAGTDIPLGIPVAGRNDVALDELIGFFVNTLVLRTDVSGNPTYRELVDRVRNADLAAFAYQDVPFERLVELLNPMRSMARHPLFQVSLVMQNGADDDLVLPGLQAEFLHVGMETAKFDLTVSLTEIRGPGGGPGGLIGDLEYAKDVFDRSTAEQLAARYVRVLKAVAADPDARLNEVDILSAEERRQVLADWNDTAAEVPSDCLPDLFDAQVAATPEATAVVFEGAELTYAQVNERANRLGRYLIAQGAGPEQIVAVAMAHTAEQVLVLLAVLKSGAAYLPVDPQWPADRVGFMLADAKPTLLVCDQLMAGWMQGEHLPQVILAGEACMAVVAEMPGGRLEDRERLAPLTVEHPACVIYTSRGAGQPSGVVVSHRNVVHLIAETSGWFDFGVNDVWTLFHSYASDLSVWEMWGALTTGGRLVVVPHRVSRSAEEFGALLAAERVTVLNQKPTAFYKLMKVWREGTGLAVRLVIFEGGALDCGRVARWQREVPRAPMLVNMYGYSETTVHVTAHVLGVAADRPAPLVGTVMSDLHVLVLDDWLQLVPPGVAGELYVAGAGLARGYLNRPGLTAERFVACPFGRPGERMYRSGDLARWGTGGELEILGGADDLVKVRGFRVQLVEVEAALAGLAGVAHAAATVREDVPGDRWLAGYVVPAEGARLDLARMRSAAGRVLPEYMVPSAFVVLDALPLTANGKVDRGALPAPDMNVPSDGAPRTAHEEILCGIFAELLSVERVGIDESFFDLGGNSLLAMRLVSLVRSVLGGELHLRMLFEAPTVRGLAGSLSQSPTSLQPPLRPLKRRE